MRLRTETCPLSFLYFYTLLSRVGYNERSKMKCYDRITGKVYESSYNIIEEAEKRFTKTVNNKLIGTLDEYFIWMIDMFSSNWLDIDNVHTIVHKLNLEETVGEIEFGSEMDKDNTVMLVLDFVV